MEAGRREPQEDVACFDIGSWEDEIALDSTYGEACKIVVAYKMDCEILSKSCKGSD